MESEWMITDDIMFQQYAVLEKSVGEFGSQEPGFFLKLCDLSA